MRLDAEIIDKENEKKRELENAKERQIYNPLEKTFDYSKRRVTDIKENSKVYLPKPANPKIEGELEMIRNVLMEEFSKYKSEIERENEKEREKRKNGENKENIGGEKEREIDKEEKKRKERNQEGRN